MNIIFDVIQNAKKGSCGQLLFHKFWNSTSRKREIPDSNLPKNIVPNQIKSTLRKRYCGLFRELEPVSHNYCGATSIALFTMSTGRRQQESTSLSSLSSIVVFSLASALGLALTKWNENKNQSRQQVPSSSRWIILIVLLNVALSPSCCAEKEECTKMEDEHHFRRHPKCEERVLRAISFSQILKFNQ